MRGRWGWATWIVGAVVLAGAAAFVMLARPTVPDTAAKVAIARTVVTDTFGGECLPRLDWGSGWADLCWAVSRLTNEADDSQDTYMLTVYGSHEGLRWLVVRSDLIGNPAGSAFTGWPKGTFEGSCRQVDVSVMPLVGDPRIETLCGRTEARIEPSAWTYEVVWTCERCLLPNADTRGVALYNTVAVPQGTSPAWDLFAEGGT